MVNIGYCKKRVSAGATYFDGINPRWFHLIDLNRLDMNMPCDCICGQQYGSFYNTQFEVNRNLAKCYGLWHVSDGDDDIEEEYKVLTGLWRQEIEWRLEMEVAVGG
jgi:hypothetical protein